MSEQVPGEETSLAELYESVCKERCRLRDELQESRRRVDVCALEREQMQGMYDDMESLSTRLSDKLDQNQKECSQAIAEMRRRLKASKRDLASVKSENSALNERLEQAEQDKKLLSAEAKKFKAELKGMLKTHVRDDRENSKALLALQAQLQQSSVDLSRAKEEKEALDRVLGQLCADHQSLKVELAKTREEKDGLSCDLGQLRTDHQSLEAEIAKAREEKDGLNRELGQLRTDHQVLKESKAAIERRMAEAEEEMEKERSGLSTIVLEWEASLEAVEVERNTVLEEHASVRAQNSVLEKERDDAEARAAVKANAVKVLSEEKSRLSALLLEARKSLVTMEIKASALEESAESEIREIRSLSEAERKLLEEELVEATGRLATVEAQKLHLEESNAILGERATASGKRTEKERSDLARLLLESEESLKAVEDERDALSEENGSLKDQMAEVERRALSRGWEEEKARLIEEKRTAEKEKERLEDCLRGNVELEREVLAQNRELVIRQEELEKFLKDAIGVTAIGDDKENGENPKSPKGGKKNPKSPKGGKKNKGLVLGSNAGSLPAPPRPPLTPNTKRRLAIDP